MDDELDDILDASSTGPRVDKAPGGLVALCILTIVGSVLILFKDYLSYSFYSSLWGFADAVGNNDDLIRSTGLGWIPFVYLGEAISCLLTLTAAILMLKLKKIGFVLYVIGTVLYAISIIWFWVIAMRAEISEGLIFLLVVYLAVPLAFIAMFGANRKYLR